MTYNYLWLVNRLCHKLNEVPLTESNFDSAIGVYTDFKESINAAIYDIYQEEDVQWPFAFASTTLTTAIGRDSYTPITNALIIDWDSFYIQRPFLSVTSLTRTGTTATATTSVVHGLVTGDSVVVQNADDTNYNGQFNITVTSSTQFTFTVSSSAVSPDTSVTIQAISPVSTKKLLYIDYNSFLEEKYLDQNGEAYRAGQYGIPDVVARKTDNTIVISPKPDRVYTIPYDYFAGHTDLVNATDIPIVPENFKQTIVDGGIYHAYMFRDNVEEATLASDKFTKGVNKMRRILIPQPDYVRVVN